MRKVLIVLSFVDFSQLRIIVFFSETFKQIGKSFFSTCNWTFQVEKVSIPQADEWKEEIRSRVRGNKGEGGTRPRIVRDPRAFV